VAGAIVAPDPADKCVPGLMARAIVKLPPKPGLPPHRHIG
jgi:hypothetical protein